MRGADLLKELASLSPISSRQSPSELAVNAWLWLSVAQKLTRTSDEEGEAGQEVRDASVGGVGSEKRYITCHDVNPAGGEPP